MRIFRGTSRKKGLAPGVLVHVGEKHDEPVSYEKIVYNVGKCVDERPVSLDDLLKFEDHSNVYWLNINGIHDTKVIERIGGEFNLHPLILEDILNTEQRPKIWDYGDFIFVVLKMLSFDDASKSVKTEQVSFVLGANYVLSFQERKGDVFDPLRERLKKDNTGFRKSGADYLLYALMDSVVDHYFIILEKIGDHLEEVEDSVTKETGSEPIQTLHKLKRELILLRKSVWPLREIVNSIQKGGFSIFKKSTLPFLRDVYDHTVQIIEAVETYRDLSSGVLDMHMNIVSNKMNEIMKVLTIIATIFIPLTFIAGIYGMNFKFMPEIDWKPGYPLALGLMFVSACGMMFFFKKKKWL